MSSLYSGMILCFMFNSFLASGDVCHLLMAFANSLDRDQEHLS